MHKAHNMVTQREIRYIDNISFVNFRDELFSGWERALPPEQWVKYPLLLHETEQNGICWILLLLSGFIAGSH